MEFKELDMATKMREQLRLDGRAGTGPDVLTLPHDQIGQLATEGLIEPLDVESSDIRICTQIPLFKPRPMMENFMAFQKLLKLQYLFIIRI